MNFISNGGLIAVFGLVVLLLQSGCATTYDAQNDPEYLHKQEAINLKYPIYFNSVYSLTPNSANGVSVAFSGQNLTEKTIKYITVDLQPYNAVGDKVTSSIGQKSLARTRLTGPIFGLSDFSPIYENVWYNQTIDCVTVENIAITFMDNTEARIVKNVTSKGDLKLTNALSTKIDQTCAPKFLQSPSFESYENIRKTAIGWYKEREKNQQYALESLRTLERYYKDSNDNSADALAWTCKVVGRHGSAGMISRLKVIVNGAYHRKVTNHCEEAMSILSR